MGENNTVTTNVTKRIPKKVHIIDSITIPGTSVQFPNSSIRVDFYIKTISKWIDGSRYEKKIPAFRVLGVNKDGKEIIHPDSCSIPAENDDDLNRIISAMKTIKERPNIKSLINRYSDKTVIKKNELPIENKEDIGSKE